MITTKNGMKYRLDYLETIIIPYGTGSYILSCKEGTNAKVLKIFIKK
ncbi:MAG: hypothetical protein QME45_09940 [Clostridiales bacterium]|nr:hypothetical protein [Clostridiales bacterium]